MSELDQLRQEAEQLKNQIRVCIVCPEDRNDALNVPPNARVNVGRASTYYYCFRK